MRTTGNTILVTGGGSGIGAALARRWHEAGNRVIVAGRRQDALERTIAGAENMHALTFDAGDAASVADLAKRVLAEHPDLNILVNNAGIMRLEPIDTARDLAAAEATVTTNLLGPIRLIDALVDHLAARPDAAIVNVTSGLAFVPMTAAAVYSATKAALHSYTVSLRAELAGRVEVIELAPPAVRTALTPGQEDRAGYMPLDDFADEVMTLFVGDPTPPEIVVDRARALRTAEAERRFDETLTQLNDFARRERERSGG